jgi:hypothetical protein
MGVVLLAVGIRAVAPRSPSQNNPWRRRHPGEVHSKMGEIKGQGTQHALRRMAWILPKLHLMAGTPTPNRGNACQHMKQRVEETGVAQVPQRTADMIYVVELAVLDRGC